MPSGSNSAITANLVRESVLNQARSQLGSHPKIGDQLVRDRVYDAQVCQTVDHKLHGQGRQQHAKDGFGHRQS